MSESVKVAVRCRPFNQREKDREAKLIIQMTGNQTVITNPNAVAGEEPKKFAFDFSYWSHDGFKEQSDGILEGTSDRYATQRKVYNDLGQGVLDNAFGGYNCSLFAYGQTGSGKSYSMVGYGANRGIVPITCDELFKAMDQNTDKDLQYRVTFSMLEIYNEQVRDLLSKQSRKGGLQVRQHPSKGFYVQDLLSVPVSSYAEIEKKMNEGTMNRTVASTQMNATSSRAHTVVTILFEQISNPQTPNESKKSSTINLVDLAGSERADATGATGDRLKEGANINKSLSTLGNVISALAEKSGGNKKIMVPYRDSVLTKLLQNALGGNSKTVMIAALSPADINYDETLSTLRYADRAKKIKNEATVNENPTDKLIRELKEENEKLKKLMEGKEIPSGGGGGAISGGEHDHGDLQATLQANELLLQQMTHTWEERLKEAQKNMAMEDEQLKAQLLEKQTTPHIVNLNEDKMLSNKVLHFLKPGTTRVGRPAKNSADHNSGSDQEGTDSDMIHLTGLSILPDHARFENMDNAVTLVPAAHGAKMKVNGTSLVDRHLLTHNDRLLIGSNHMYVFINPIEKVEREKEGVSFPEIDWIFAQKEIAEAKGFSGSGKSQSERDLQETIIDLLPMISQVNAISQELNKHRFFDLALIPHFSLENNSETTDCFVKVVDLWSKNEWLWPKEQFLNRKFLIEELYNHYQDGEPFPNENAQDPFWDEPGEVLIGNCHVYLESLGYKLDVQDELVVSNYLGVDKGTLKINIAPCDINGKPFGDDQFVEDPEEMLGESMKVKFTVDSLTYNSYREGDGLYCKYKFFDNAQWTETDRITGTNHPRFNHTSEFDLLSINKDVINYFTKGTLEVQVFVVQIERAADKNLQRMTTKELGGEFVAATRRITMSMAQHVHDPGSTGTDQELHHYKTDYLKATKKAAFYEEKNNRIKEILKQYEAHTAQDGDKNATKVDSDKVLRQISAICLSTGTKLKARAQMIIKGRQMAKIYMQHGDNKGSTGGGGDKQQETDPFGAVPLPNDPVEEEENDDEDPTTRRSTSSDSAGSSITATKDSSTKPKPISGKNKQSAATDKNPQNNKKKKSSSSSSKNRKSLTPSMSGSGSNRPQLKGRQSSKGNLLKKSSAQQSSKMCLIQ